MLILEEKEVVFVVLLLAKYYKLTCMVIVFPFRMILK